VGNLGKAYKKTEQLSGIKKAPSKLEAFNQI
jgi:hypothetical protein